MEWFEIISLVVIAYLVGSIPTAVWVGKAFYGIDIREHGSGNAGATNTIRVLGYKAGIPVMVVDVFKGWVAVQIAVWLPFPDIPVESMTYVMVGCAVAAVLGHIFPFYAGYRGGKGVGTLAGVGLALYPVALLIVLAIFIVTLILTRYVSLSSILGAISFPFVVYFIVDERNLALLGLALFVAIFIPLTHRKNIDRLIHRKEKKFDFRRKQS